MKTNIRSLIVSLGLSLVFVMLLWITYVVLVGGPARAQEAEDRYYIEQMMQREGYVQAELLNRFSLDDVYYIVSVDDGGVDTIVWFSRTLSIIETRAFVSLETVHPLAYDMGFSAEEVSYGIYEDDVVFVLKKGVHEIFISLEHLEVVFEVGSVV